MSLPKPKLDMRNSRTAMGIAKASANTHIASSSQKSAPDIQTRTTTPIIAAPPDVPAMIGVMCVISRTSAPHMFWVAFCAAKSLARVTKVPDRAYLVLL